MLKSEKIEVATEVFETLKELNVPHKEFIKGFMTGILFAKEKKLEIQNENKDEEIKH